MENTFITYEKALSILEAHREGFPEESRNLADCVGQYLAEDLISDRDFPPFDRVTMDGIAISHATFGGGSREFPIQEVAPAGTPRKTLQNPAHCIEVMTGAIMPEKADTVIRYEDLEISDGKARVRLDSLTPRQNIHFKGMDLPKGTVIVSKGRQLSSAEINIAAAVGKPSLRVRKLPRAAIICFQREI
ncbi:MAG: hypothetical protein P8Z38_08160 [Robiginitalea sp.]